MFSGFCVNVLHIDMESSLFFFVRIVNCNLKHSCVHADSFMLNTEKTIFRYYLEANVICQKGINSDVHVSITVMVENLTTPAGGSITPCMVTLND